ncbi:MAG: SCO family protein [Myxococcota bacterium]|nr:SCO family protein [Myxococcota bacterium]
MRRGAAALALAGALVVGAARAHEPAPEAPALAFELPEPGSYALPAIDRVAEATLLDADARDAPLLGLAEGQVALVSFVYTRCPDGGGCPAVIATLQRIDRLLARDPELAARVRLTTVSFDPGYDTPERLAELRHHMRPRADWRFLTAPNDAAIAPVLSDFGQDALRLVDPAGDQLGLFRHVLKVFLVDASGAVRNIYSAGFLLPELLLVDARTVLLDAGARDVSQR